MSCKIRTQKYEEMFPDEVFDEMARNPIIYLSFGGLETHGPHNPLGIDMLPWYGLALEAAEKTGGIVHPPVYMATPGMRTSSEIRKLTFLSPPSVWHGSDLIKAWLEETLWNFDKMGFKICVLLPGHAPNINLVNAWNHEINGRFGNMDLVVYDCLPVFALAGFTREECGHGAMMESAWQEELYPGTVDLKRIQRSIEREPDVAALNKRYQWQSRQVQSYRRIAVEKGRKAIDMSVNWIVKEVGRLRAKSGSSVSPFNCCPGYVSTYRVSRIRSFSGSFDAIPYPEAVQIKKFSLRVFRKTLCVIPECADIFKGKSLLFYCGFNLICSMPMRLDFCFGYDAPVKVWVDQTLRFCDEHGKSPASGPNGDKVVIALELSRGRHEVLIALVSRGLPVGFFVRLQKGRDAAGAAILEGLPKVDVAHWPVG